MRLCNPNDAGYDSGLAITNIPHQHAFILVGDQQFFGVHMTQYHCEIHKYQLVVRLRFPDSVAVQLRALRRNNPSDTFVLCNAKNGPPAHNDDVSYQFNIPELACGRVVRFHANIFQGIRPLAPQEMDADPHFFPWAGKYCRPAIGGFVAVAERIVCFRPFDHLHSLPRFASYLLFGDGRANEAHMTNLQTARCISGPFEPPVFGPDYDHVLSLAERPSWLPQDALLEAGIVVTTPSVELVCPESGQPSIPAANPFPPEQAIEVLYRGIGAPLQVVAGDTYLYATLVCNSEAFFAPHPSHCSYLDQLPPVPPALDISMMPSQYWAYADN